MGYIKEITSRLIVQDSQCKRSLLSIKMLLFYNKLANTHVNSTFLKRLATISFPITSIFLGIEILKLTFTTPGSIGRKIAYTIFGCIATLGLGIIIVAIQTCCVLLLSILAYIVILRFIHTNTPIIHSL